MATLHKLSRGTMVLTFLAVIGWTGTWPTHAQEAQAARAHVEATIEQIFQLVRANLPRKETAMALRKVFEQRTAFAQLARFSSGRYWRNMSSDERARYTESFSSYVSFVYAGYFREFEGDIEDLRAVVNILGVSDAGNKGVIVRTEIRPVSQVGISIDWLVSDRSGRIAISDIMVEGISLAITQREMISTMLDARNGDVDKLIADLSKQQANALP